MNAQSDDQRQVLSYLTLRRTLGILGLLFPVLLALGCLALGACTTLQDSISHYYHTGVRDVFVGVLFAIGWFLFSYKGYERKDDLAGDLACVFALCVALFPTESKTEAFRVVHFASAGALFLVLSFFSLCLFTKSGDTKTREKKIRNRVYVACGVVMLLCIVLIAVFFAFLQDTAIADWKPTFWLEAIALWAFGISWLVKGETLWRDRKP